MDLDYKAMGIVDKEKLIKIVAENLEELLEVYASEETKELVSSYFYTKFNENFGDFYSHDDEELVRQYTQNGCIKTPKTNSLNDLTAEELLRLYEEQKSSSMALQTTHETINETLAKALANCPEDFEV